jgi:hypothetical protein
MKRFLAAAAVLASALAITLGPALSANAATGSRSTVATPHPAAGRALARTEVVPPAAPGAAAEPLYSQDITLSIKCASWSGELAWGGNGSILVPAYIDISGTLKDTCSSGYAQLFAHWDTIDNPKNPLVKKVNANSSAKTPYSTSDNVNTYKDIYVYICSEYQGYRCSAHKGPGA